MSSSVSSPRVSVAICLCNSSTYILETLDSVFSQTLQDFEVVLVDDGSTDGGAELIESHYRDPRVRLVRQPNRGLGAARRVSVAQAKGDYIAFLDHDDLWLPQKLEMQMRVASEHPEVALICSDCLLVDASGATIRRLSTERRRGSMDRSGIRDLTSLLRDGCFVDLSTAVAKAAALKQAGSFNANYRYVEDYDMWIRIARRHNLFYIAEPLAKRRIHPAQFTQTHPRVAVQEQTHALRPIARGASYPTDLRNAVAKYILAEHRRCFRSLLRIGQFRHAALTGLEAMPAAALVLRNRVVGTVRRSERPPLRIWVDGGALAGARVGYFNLVAELVRVLLRRGEGRWTVHVDTTNHGASALRERLGGEPSHLRLCTTSWVQSVWPRAHTPLLPGGYVRLSSTSHPPITGRRFRSLTSCGA